MTKKQYFVKTFVYAFLFSVIFRFGYQLASGFETITVDSIINTLYIGFTVGVVLGIVNYFLQYNFFPGKNKNNKL